MWKQKRVFKHRSGAGALCRGRTRKRGAMQDGQPDPHTYPEDAGPPMPPVLEEVIRFIQDLKDDDYGVRIQAIQSLSRIGEPAVLPLLEALKDNHDVRFLAMEALGNIGDTRAVLPLIAILTDISDPLSIMAAQVLGILGSPAVPSLIREFKNTRQFVAPSVASVLVRIGEPSVLPLIETLQEDDYTVRAKAARTLGEIGDARAVLPLIEMRKDSHDDVRYYASAALSAIGDMNTLPLRVLGSQHLTPVQKKDALETLRQIEPQRSDAKPLIFPIGPIDKYCKSLCRR